MRVRQLFNLLTLVVLPLALGSSLGLAQEIHQGNSQEVHLVDTFDAEVVSGVDADSNGVGFVVWHDGSGQLELQTVRVEPDDALALPNQEDTRHVLVVHHRIADWGGFTHAFTDEALGSWQYRDWSAFQGIRFWFKGSATGQEIQFDLFDNRNPGMRGDSAERYYYRFTDEAQAWRLIEIPFSSLQRRTDWQPAGAPNDGLTLTQVWGYALGFPPGDAQSALADVTLYGADAQVAARIEVAFSHASFEVNQGETAQATVSLSAPHDEAINVGYRVEPQVEPRFEPQSARLERDIEAVTGQLTFLPGETEKVVTVETFDSGRYTGDLTAELVLEHPENAHLGFQHRATLVLRDTRTPDAALLDDFERGVTGLQSIGAAVVEPQDVEADHDLARPEQAAVEGVLEVRREGQTDPAGVIRRFDTAQDWQGRTGVSFWYFGTGTGEEVTLELHSARSTDVGEPWEVVWSDEFDGPAGTLPDPAVWTPEVGDGTKNGIPGWGNAERQYYTDNPENLSLDGQGNLIITARAVEEEALECYYGPCEYTSARIITWGDVEVEYGRIEARMRLPEGQGIWPAFWMLGTNLDTAGWPQSGEIDIMENIGREPNIVHGTVHGPGYSGAQGIGGAYTQPEGMPFAADFHVYAIEWQPDEIRWFVDDRHYFTLTPGDLPARADWVFDHPFFIILNVAVGGQWPGYPDETTRFPQEMAIDYVRMYVTPDTSARFSTHFTDDTAGWRLITLPFTAFTRSPQQPANAPGGDLDLSEVWAYSLTWPEGTTGTVYLDQLRLEEAQ
jgi:beta-glucanase (GH16 family)